MDEETLAYNDMGVIKLLCSKRCSCVTIRFNNLFWKFSWQNISSLKNYVEYLLTPEGFVDNQLDTDCTVLAMQDHVMMALIKRTELHALHTLLEKAQIEYTRRQLKTHFVEPTS
jgi:hypothetical protein